MPLEYAEEIEITQEVTSSDQEGVTTALQRYENRINNLENTIQEGVITTLQPYANRINNLENTIQDNSALRERNYQLHSERVEVIQQKKIFLNNLKMFKFKFLDFMDEEVELNFEGWNEKEENWPEYQQEEENPWNCDEKEESTWSINNEEVEEPTTSLSIEQENPSDVVVGKTNDNYYFEFGLLVLVLVLMPFSMVLSWICCALLLYRAKFLLAKLRLADGDYVTLLDPLSIRYSQMSIRDVFQHSNRPIEDTINQLLEDGIDSSLAVSNTNGQIFFYIPSKILGERTKYPSAILAKTMTEAAGISSVVGRFG
ncbi:17669_t:CDS:2, partial [Dentiscutata erythropus]